MIKLNDCNPAEFLFEHFELCPLLSDKRDGIIVKKESIVQKYDICIGFKI